MSEPIRFDRTKFDSKGRNGYFGTTGINVVDLGVELFLEPITTRGINSEACRIVLPKSAITALIEALEEIAPIQATCPGSRSGEQGLDHPSTPARGAAAAAELSARCEAPQEQPMPRYIIERQYLLPVYQHLALESPDLESACSEALDDGEHDWEGAQEDYESSRPTTIVSAIEIASEAEWATVSKSQHERSGLMYDGRHEFIEIPRKFTEADQVGELAEILERNDCGKGRVLIDGDDLERLKSVAGMRVDR